MARARPSNRNSEPSPLPPALACAARFVWAGTTARAACPSQQQGAELTSPSSRAESEARQSILNQILHPEAADRLGRIRLVKESRAVDVENRLIMLARTGQLRQKVTEDQLKELLNAVADTREEEKIVVSRRKGWEDDDDDLLNL